MPGEIGWSDPATFFVLRMERTTVIMRVAASIVLLAMTAAPAAAQSPREPEPHVLHAAIAAAVIAQFADVATTEYALGTGRFREANPLLRWSATNPVRMAIVKGGIATASSYALLKIHKDHPKLAFTAAVVSTAATSYAAWRNSASLRSAARPSR